tara:strand:+ start:1244 stop:1420 length:177 start_codon:yes stop_codon:yes gene_type:complete
MKEWLQTFIETDHFPFYEFLWLCMLGLWWSVIARLKRIEQKVIDIEQDAMEYITGEDQ